MSDSFSRSNKFHPFFVVRLLRLIFLLPVAHSVLAAFCGGVLFFLLLGALLSYNKGHKS